ncbi:uncharacterized protein PAC_15176 [Phialocephala subalpina]|uniref:Uncharacterized protein n=1 Tax=Phialocephala subalpina TaxID=576137 RepID=A0A1L7XK15_9HELO|nr:uncharacterized protein PAC_15176 [Phialocephala subalpina]
MKVYKQALLAFQSQNHQTISTIMNRDRLTAIGLGVGATVLHAYNFTNDPGMTLWALGTVYVTCSVVVYYRQLRGKSTRDNISSADQALISKTDQDVGYKIIPDWAKVLQAMENERPSLKDDPEFQSQLSKWTELLDNFETAKDSQVKDWIDCARRNNVSESAIKNLQLTTVRHESKYISRSYRRPDPPDRAYHSSEEYEHVLPEHEWSDWAWDKKRGCYYRAREDGAGGWEYDHAPQEYGDA